MENKNLDNQICPSEERENNTESIKEVARAITNVINGPNGQEVCKTIKFGILVCAGIYLIEKASWISCGVLSQARMSLAKTTMNTPMRRARIRLEVSRIVAM